MALTTANALQSNQEGKYFRVNSVLSQSHEAAGWSLGGCREYRHPARGSQAGDPGGARATWSWRWEGCTGHTHPQTVPSGPPQKQRQGERGPGDTSTSRAGPGQDPVELDFHVGRRED